MPRATSRAPIIVFKCVFSPDIILVVHCDNIGVSEVAITVAVTPVLQIAYVNSNAPSVSPRIPVINTATRKFLREFSPILPSITMPVRVKTTPTVNSLIAVK